MRLRYGDYGFRFLYLAFKFLCISSFVNSNSFLLCNFAGLLWS